MKTIWKIQPSRRGYAGFTLIELLIVIAIIAILAALTMGAFRYAQEAAARNRTTAALTAIKGALERYKEKFGEYPEPSSPGDDAEFSGTRIRVSGARVLYQAITGDGTDAIKLASATPSDGKVDETESENVIDGSMPKSVIYKTNSGYVFIDGFSRPFQYDKGMIGDPPAANPDAINPTFDIWSFGNQPQGKAFAYDAATKKDPSSTGTWIKNW